METRTNRKGASSEVDSRNDNPTFNDIIDAIKNLAITNARSPLETEEQMMLFLSSWWSRTYNRPLKDPLLKQYSFEELLYEFYDRAEREKAAQETTEQQSDKIEQDKEKEALDWAELEEKRELEELAKKQGQIPTSKEQINDPANKKWMEEQLAEQKKLLGDDFGEDVDFSMGD